MNSDARNHAELWSDLKFDWISIAESQNHNGFANDSGAVEIEEF